VFFEPGLKIVIILQVIDRLIETLLLLDNRALLAWCSSVAPVGYVIIIVAVVLFRAGICVRIDVMHSLEISIVDTRGAICGVIIKVRLEEILRGWR
jgi:hypothetical protein